MSEKELHGSWDESMIECSVASAMPGIGFLLVRDNGPNAFILLALLIALAVVIYLSLRGRSGGSRTTDGSSGYYGGFHDGPGNSDGDPGGGSDSGGSDGGDGGVGSGD